MTSKLQISILVIHIHKLVWNTKSIGRSFIIKYPWTERPNFKSPRFAQNCVNPTITTPSSSIPSFSIHPYMLNASIGSPLFANPLIMVVQQTRSLLSILSNTTIGSSIFWHFAYKFKTEDPTNTSNSNPQSIALHQTSSLVFKSDNLVHALRVTVKVKLSLRVWHLPRSFDDIDLELHLGTHCVNWLLSWHSMHLCLFKAIHQTLFKKLQCHLYLHMKYTLEHNALIYQNTVSV